MHTGAMLAATVGVSNLAQAIGLFCHVMGLRMESDTMLSRAQRGAWGLGACDAARLVELSCDGYPVGRLRLLQTWPADRQAVRLDPLVGGSDHSLAIGPKALDFYVRPPIQGCYDELVRAGCVPRSAPIRYEIGGLESEELVLFGPDGVPLLLMVGHRHASRSMRADFAGRYSEIPTISIVAGDLEATRRFYIDGLGLTATTDAEVEDRYRDLACELTGAPRGSRIHFLLVQDPAEPSGKLLLVHFHGASPQRLTDRMRPGRLGVVLYTHAVDDLAALARRVPDFGGKVVGGPLPALDGRGEALLVRGPNEELFEFVSR